MSHQARSWRIALALLLVVTFGPVRAWGEEEAPANPPPADEGPVSIDCALAEESAVECMATPWGDVLAYLKERHRIDLHANGHAVKEAGITLSVPVTLNVRGVSLKSALNLLLADLPLTWIVDKDSVVVTSLAKARSQAIRQTYDIAGLIDRNGEEALDAAAIAALARTMVDAADCGEAGLGEIKPQGDSLVVTHNRFAHELLADLLAELRAIQAVDNAAPAGQSDQEAKLVAALDSQCELQVAKERLNFVAEYLSSKHEIPILIDHQALRRDGIGHRTPITASIRGKSLRDALESLLDDLELTWRIDNETLQITTKKAANKALDVHVYDIADMQAAGTDSKELIEAIEKLPAIVEQASPDKGNLGTVRAMADVLVICQSDLAHRQIQEMLNDLRSKADKE
jgi:hypothetical protein